MKRFVKRPIGILVSIILVFSLFNPVVLASTNYDIKKEVSIEIKQGRYNSSTTSGSTYNVSNYDQFRNGLMKSIDTIEESTKIVCENNYLSGSFDEFISVFKDITSMVAAGSYIKSYSIYYYTQNNKRVYEVVYNYHNGINDAKKKEAEVRSAVTKTIANIITPYMGDYEKEKAIHDYVVNTARYDVENMEKDSYPPESHTAYGVFIKKVAVCEGYASAVKKLLDAVNIENLIVVGDADGVPHAWNLVKIDRYWNHVDTTWDDPIVFSGGKQVSVLRYDYFNKTDSFMSKTHTWIKSNYPKADGKPVETVKKGTRFIDSKYIIR